MSLTKAIAILGAGAGLLYLVRTGYIDPSGIPGGSTIKETVMPKIPYPSLTKEQRTANADLIISMFQNAGYSARIAKAAVVNAWAESGLNHLAIGDGGLSIGLFQLHARGAGKYWYPEGKDPTGTNHPMAVPLIEGRPPAHDPRFNAAANVTRIIREVQRYGSKLVAADKAGQPVYELAAIFSRDIERPADQAGQMAARSAIAKQWYPGE